MAIDNNATIRFFGLDCLETYTVIAGGTLNGALVGPRSSRNITTGDCMVTVAPTTSTMIGKILSNCNFNLQFTVHVSNAHS